MPDHLKYGTFGWIKRQLVHRHNGFFGGVAMAKANMQRIIDSETATEEAKHQARIIHSKLIDLGHMLKTRVDPQRTQK